MSLKSRINNYAKSRNIAAQAVMQNFMFERFLDRLSRTKYKNKFVIKGGVLITALVGIDTRTTMDLDVTLRNLPLTGDDVVKAINEICQVNTDDNVVFEYKSIELIRKDDIYGGYRIKLFANYGKIQTPLSIDVSTGDVVTPNPIEYSYPLLFDDGNSIMIYGYNIETVLAEKLHAIISKGEGSSRLKDYYDVYILINKQKFSKNTINEAFHATLKHRSDLYLLNDIESIYETIKTSKILEAQWIKYQNTFSYARYISYEEIIKSIGLLIDMVL